ncbi:MAG: DNA-methyltransferase [Phycisphaerae bacterium]
MIEIFQGDVRDKLAELPGDSVQCVVTSPPYWGLRDYGVPGQLGLEPTPEEYVANMVEVFRGVWRVLKPDGALWLVLADSYFGSGVNDGTKNPGLSKAAQRSSPKAISRRCSCHLKPKDLCGIPWRVALALQADGWWLRQDIIWSKRSCMPESVTDRCTKSHEYVFMLTKSGCYYYDAEAVKEAMIGLPHAPGNRSSGRLGSNGRTDNCVHESDRVWGNSGHRNRRSVWTIPTAPYAEAHFATFPPTLPRLCILAGSRPGDTVLDPFAGSGTTGMVAIDLARKAVLIELNPEYVELIRQRCDVTLGMPLSC